MNRKVFLLMLIATFLVMPNAFAKKHGKYKQERKETRKVTCPT